MDRLTRNIRTEYEDKWVADDAFETEEHFVRGKAIDKLAAYEDTGLEPEEIIKLDNEIEKLYEKLYEKLSYYQTAGNSKNRITRTWKGHQAESWEDYSMRCVQKLTALEDLEEQGLLIKLPCKVGDSIYFITQELDIVKGSCRKVIDEYIVTEIRGNKYNPLWFMASSERCIHRDFHPTEIGKKVFLTREEAEIKLKEE